MNLEDERTELLVVLRFFTGRPEGLCCCALVPAVTRYINQVNSIKV
jgi:hypothetical protein